MTDLKHQLAMERRLARRERRRDEYRRGLRPMAIAAAVSAGVDRFQALAVVTDTDPPASPCGACRQVLVEFGDFPVILANLAGDRVMTSVAELLPNAFTPTALLNGR